MSSHPDSLVDRPLVALTIGDVAGIGPEVTVRAAVDAAVQRQVRPLIVGDPAIVRRALNCAGIDATVEVVASPGELSDDDSATHLYCWPADGPDVGDVAVGQVSARAGQAAHDYLIAAVDAALANSIDAIVTAPLNKYALRQAGILLPGHTEILAQRCDVQDVAMMLHLPIGGPIRVPFGLSVAHTTLHTSIESVPRLLSAARITETIRLMDGFLRQLGADSPRIGVCALNPHAGEEGLFGGEEATTIEPAIANARETRASTQIAGPLPADTLFKRAVVDEEFDGIVAMYHDQGHIAFKLIGFDRAVNITLGLPIIRTSPSHGTAFDIAWQGKANPAGMIAAILTAARLVESGSS